MLVLTGANGAPLPAHAAGFVRDHVDLVVKVGAAASASTGRGECTGAVAARIAATRRRRMAEPDSPWSGDSRRVLDRAAERFAMTPADVAAAARVASTICCLAGDVAVLPVHVREALWFRRRATPP